MTIASIALFREPGFIASLLVCFTLAYLVSMKARPGWQIALCIYFGSYDITHWMGGTYWTIALFWTYAGWAGFLFEKIGGGQLTINLTIIIKGWFHNFGQPSTTGRRSFYSRPHNASDGSHSQRKQEHAQAEAAFRERERKRMEEEARRAYQEAADAMENEPETTDHTTNDDEPPDAENEPTPEPETDTKRPWWEVLGVSASANKTEIKKAYLSLMQKYHPDKVSHLGEELQAVAEKKAKEINAAYDEATSR